MKLPKLPRHDYKWLDGYGMDDQGKDSKALSPSQEEAKAKSWWQFWK